MNRSLRPARIAVVVLAATIVEPAGLALAGEPIVHNCIGTTSSTNARALGGLGERRSGYAQADDGRPGFGDSIDFLAGGVVPDELANNTCNDG